MPGAAPIADEVVTVQAATRVAGAAAEIVRFVQPGPFDRTMRPLPGYRLDLCLTPRPQGTRACYPDPWGPHRFEPLGDLFLVPPGYALHTRGESGRQLSVVCELRRDTVERWLDQPIEWTDRRLEASMDVSWQRLRALLGWLAEELYQPAAASEAAVALIAGQLAIEVGRFCRAVADGPASGGLGAWRLRVIDERLRQGGPPPSLGELAGLCNLSIRQLTRGFRASRGCSIADHVAHGRVAGAKRLLAGEDSIKAIAFALGFASSSSFAFAFRTATGVTPRHFRQSIARPTTSG